MDWIDQLKALANSTIKDPNWQAPPNEEATKLALVVPFISILGYNPHDNAEVMPEFSADLRFVKARERVDYAILENNQPRVLNNQPRILIEVKAYQVKLDEAERGQLERYFHATNVRIGILTNGHIYQLFTDLDEANTMDKKPFTEINLQSLCRTQLNQLECITKSKFDLDKLLAIAEKFKYEKGIEDLIRQESTDPSDEVVKGIAKRVYKQVYPSKKINITSQIKDSFRSIIPDVIKSYILNEANKMNETKENNQKPDEYTAKAERTNGISETQEAIKPSYIDNYFNIIKEICKDLVEPSRITKDYQKDYCKITLDGRRRKKTFLQLHYNNPVKNKRVALLIFDLDKDQPQDVYVTDSADLYQYQERIRKALKLKL